MIELIKDKLIIIPWVLSIAVTVLDGSIVFINFAGDNSQFVVNYSYALKPLLGDADSLYSILGVLIGLLIINLALTFYIYSKQKFLSYVISIATLAISLIFFITILAVTSIN